MYLVFAGPDYHHGGGWEDYEESFDSIKSAEDFVKLNKEKLRDGMDGWYQIVDFTNRKMVIEGRLGKTVLN